MKDTTYIYSLRYGTNELTYERETGSQTRRAGCGGQGRGRGSADVGWQVQAIIQGWTNNKDLLCGKGSYIQYPTVNHMEKDKK